VYSYLDYPAVVCEDLVRLRRAIARSGIPTKQTDRNLIIGTWNLRKLGRVHPSFEENRGSPKRNLRALAYIAEVVRCFDVIAIQEVLRDTSAVRTLVDDFLGPDWGVVLSDVTAGDKGLGERLGYLYDRRRVQPSGLAGEIVLPPQDNLNPQEQFDRTPYFVGFRANQERFSLLTAHIRFGDSVEHRKPEIERLARYTATEIRDRARFAGAEETNLIVLGDFNIEARRTDDPLFAALLASGLMVPEALRDVRTNYGQAVKHYDQIAWFMGDLALLTKGRAGVVDYRGTVFKELTARQVTDRVSDHLPLWAEFIIDRSAESLAARLGLDPNAPDPFASIPD
jgi:endonuclease/exonuclease/phosphatase family metal-dependent hydrolase